MKLIQLYLIVALTAISGIAWVVRVAPNPEILLLGEWKETDWLYESSCFEKKLNNSCAEGKRGSHALLGQELIIHQAETWNFRPNGELIIELQDRELTGSWCLKGRGNVLEIKYEDQFVEHYQINRIKEDSLVLYFDAEMQAKGIAQLSFSKKL